MDLFDKLALAARKYEPITVPRTGSHKFTLGDVLEMFDRHAIFELTPYLKSGPAATLRPDDVRKLKVSLLDDGISAIHTGSEEWYEVQKTPPSGDLSRVKIVAHSPDGQQVGEVRMLVGQRSFKHYFEEDPILGEIERRAK